MVKKNRDYISSIQTYKETYMYQTNKNIFKKRTGSNTKHCSNVTNRMLQNLLKNNHLREKKNVDFSGKESGGGI